MKKIPLIVIYCFVFFTSNADDGYRLWLRYDKIDDSILLSQYRNKISFIRFTDTSSTLLAAQKELQNGLEGLLDKKIFFANKIEDATILAGTIQNSMIHSIIANDSLNKIGKEGFIIQTAILNKKNIIVIAANTDIGVLYG